MNIPCVRFEIEKLVAASFIDSITTFAFLGDTFHSNADIVITTLDGRLIEFKNKDIIGSINLETNTTVESILVVRGQHENELPVYVVKSENCLKIISHEDGKLKILHTIKDVSKVNIDDPTGSGKSKIQYWTFDEVIPVTIDLDKIASIDTFGQDFNYENVNENNDTQDDEFASFLYQKLCEMRLNRAHNEEILNQKRIFRQKISMHIEEDCRFSNENLSKSEINIDMIEIGDIWYNFCNKKLVIAIPIRNISEKKITIENLFLKTELMSITYETQIFFPSKDPPFWIAKYENIIKDQESATLVAICEFPPFNNDNKALIYGCIQYCSDKMYSLPLLPIIINTMDLFSMDTDMSFKMSANFGKNEMLTTMSCGIETIYNIQHLPHKKCNLSEFFTTNLKFSMLADDNENGKIFRHYQYPHNILYGSVIYLVKDENDFSNIIVYSMNSAQAILLMQMMYKHLPIKIIDIVDVKAKNKMSNEESLDCSQYVEKLNYLISTILQYLEKCLSESPDCEIVTSNSKMQINLMACGKTEFVEFWKTIKENII